MDDQLFNYVIEGMNWFAVGGCSYLAYLSTLAGLSTLGNAFSQEIRNQKELEAIVDEEAKILGVDKPIIPIFKDQKAAFSWAINDGSYRIDIGGSCAKRNAVKHESYHIHRGDCDKKYIKLRYLFIQEPRAVLYAVFGIKL